MTSPGRQLRSEGRGPEAFVGYSLSANYQDQVVPAPHLENTRPFGPLNEYNSISTINERSARCGELGHVYRKMNALFQCHQILHDNSRPRLGRGGPIQYDSRNMHILSCSRLAQLSLLALTISLPSRLNSIRTIQRINVV